ncbi:hypothetical protein ACFV2H_02270 [Streptomyces sp. NPDC059629]|uniref:hypothetical protein n=1 Tax=Streptomyces sp. NPDC059629 TaxID=3346889 RepID=UPI003695F416
MTGVVAALRAVRGRVDLISTVVTGNLKASAVVKLEAFDLDPLVDIEIGGYASDVSHRPALVGVAQRRARDKYGVSLDRSNSVIIGDTLEDVRTGREGEAYPSSVSHPVRRRRPNSNSPARMSFSRTWRT